MTLLHKQPIIKLLILKGADSLKVDIKFIAKKAGVSPSTVSRVMNNTKHVSSELREKVTAVIKQYNYLPNSMARGLILKKSCLIGVMTPNVSNSFHSKMISAIEAEANKAGYNVIIANVHNDFEQQKNSYLSLCERQVDGIIMLHENTGEELQQLQQCYTIPTVLAGIHVTDCKLPCVAIDDQKAAQCAVEHLLKLGHKKIGGIFSDCHSLGTLRKQGYEAALKSYDISLSTELTVFTECTIDGGVEAAKKLFSVSNPPTAIFCVSDEIAIGAIDWLREIGYKIPEDISVIGFDDIVLAKVFRPRLTTVHQPIEEIGKNATQLLLKLMEHTELQNEQILLPYKIIKRESCKECRK